MRSVKIRDLLYILLVSMCNKNDRESSSSSDGGRGDLRSDPGSHEGLHKGGQGVVAYVKTGKTHAVLGLKVDGVDHGAVEVEAAELVASGIDSLVTTIRLGALVEDGELFIFLDAVSKVNKAAW
jgi:hypothetical protein